MDLNCFSFCTLMMSLLKVYLPVFVVNFLTGRCGLVFKADNQRGRCLAVLIVKLLSRFGKMYSQCRILQPGATGLANFTAKSASVKQIGFRGLAAMGFGMAAHMLKCNFLLLFVMEVLTSVGITMKNSINQEKWIDLAVFP